MLRKSKNGCALCDHQHWHCYFLDDDVAIEDPSAIPLVDYLGDPSFPADSVLRRRWVDECVTCGAVVS